MTDNGQGVSQVTFVLENTMIELLWVSDEELFRESWVAWDPLHEERANWRTTAASPFGLAFHRTDPSILELPFTTAEGWYEDLGGYVLHSDPLAPALFVMAPRTSMPEPSWMTEEGRRLRHNPAGIGSVTSVTVGSPGSLDHEAWRSLEQQGALRLKRGVEHVLELTFDDHRQGKTFDGRPALPLVLHY